MGRKNSNKKKQRHQKSASQSEFKGVLELTRSGMGYVVVKDLEADILIRPSDLNTAMHGDTVKVKTAREKKGRRMQGTVTEVLHRRQTEFIGRLEKDNSLSPKKNFAFFISESDRPMPDVYIPSSGLHSAENGSRVIVKITDWGNGEKRPTGEVVALLDALDENDIAMKEILLEYGFPLSFPDDALEVAARISDTIPATEINNRKDFRDVLTFTIDPMDAKDFDDAISFQKLDNGNYEIGVHIADVSHFVAVDSALDHAAYEKATSVYLPDRVNPMLPEAISNELCSLRPHEDKLTFSAVFEISSSTRIKTYWLGKTVIHSNHRFTYEEVQEIIEAKDGLYCDAILVLNDMAQQMRKMRIKKGAINFSSQEVRFKLDEKGKPIGIVIKESKEAHQLIEEFMLLANRTVATFLSAVKADNKPLPIPYRVHDDPDKEKLIPFIAFAKKFGHRFDTSSPDAITASFNKMLSDVRGKPEQHVLEQLGIRTMSKAKYTIENAGHYGLGFEHYCHFTSPIRRYPDMIVHRILQDALVKKPKPDKKLEEKCRHCSERERAAMEAERAANKYKQVEYMKNYLGDEFEGIISGVAAFGFWVETIEHKCEGLVSVNSLYEYDNFRLIESDYCLLGERTGRQFRIGDNVRIKVVAANMDKRQLDYEWVIASGLKEKKGQHRFQHRKKEKTGRKK
jgi:ribonuclease R